MEDYKRWLDACLQCDLPAISTDTSARLMAILYEFGNNEGFTYNQKFLADKDYIQKKFGLHEMGVVEPRFLKLLREYVWELQDYYEATKDKSDLIQRVPEWAPRLLQERYNMKFIG